MKIHFYQRSKRRGFSIGRVFQTIIEEVSKYVEYEETFLPSPRSKIYAILLNGIYSFAKQRKGTINHITGESHYLTFFLSSQRTIVTVHDIMYYYYLHGLKKKVWKLLFINSLKKAAKIVFISEFAKKQVMGCISLDETKSVVIPNPVDPQFVKSPKVFNEKKPRILHIGTLERKNLKRTVKALEGINCHLRIIGDVDGEMETLLNAKKIDYSCDYGLSNGQIIEEYKLADIINFPSCFEGFGMPIIEGQATGRIVVTSNISPMIDVAGDGAVIVDPFSVKSIHDAYKKIISDAEYRQNVVSKALENVKRYNVDRIAKQYIRVYEEIKL